MFELFSNGSRTLEECATGELNGRTGIGRPCLVWCKSARQNQNSKSVNVADDTEEGGEQSPWMTRGLTASKEGGLDDSGNVSGQNLARRILESIPRHSTDPQKGYT